MIPGITLFANGGPVKGEDLATSEAWVSPPKTIPSVNVIALSDGFNILVKFTINFRRLLLVANVAAILCDQV